MATSFKLEVLTCNEVNWAANAVRVATKEEAEAYGRELASRWLAVTDTRPAESEDPVNCRFDTPTQGLVWLDR